LLTKHFIIDKSGSIWYASVKSARLRDGDLAAVAAIVVTVSASAPQQSAALMGGTMGFECLNPCHDFRRRPAPAQP